jgi:ParB/RepB/Spo0J family partition protein
VTEQVRDIAIEDLVLSEFNPRKDPGDVEDLAASIREKGVLEPILVTKVAGNGHFAIVAGSRRVAASKIAGRQTVPAIVREMTDDEAELVSLMENLHREDLSVLETAQGYAKWLQIMGKAGRPATHDDLAKAVGKKRSSVSNILRLLKAPKAIQEGLKSGELTPTHVRQLLRLEDPALMDQIHDAANMSVQDLEFQVDELNTEHRLYGPVAEGEAKAFLAKAREQYPNADITWAKDAGGILEKWLGKPPKAIVDGDLLTGYKQHDATCGCNAYAMHVDVVDKGIGRNREQRLEFELRRVCVDEKGYARFQAARAPKPKKGKAAPKVDPKAEARAKKARAAQRERDRIKREKDTIAAGERALKGANRYNGVVAVSAIDPKLIKGGLEREPARLVLFALASKFSTEWTPGWRAALWKRISKLAISDVKKRAAEWSVRAAFAEIDSRKDERQELRELVLGHYGVAVKPEPKKAKKKARR